MTEAWTPLAQLATTSSDSSVVFSSIPSGYRDLFISVNGKRSTATGGLRIYANGDTTESNYQRIAMYGNGTDDLAFQNNESEFVYMDNTETVFQIQIFDYASTNKHTAFLARSDEASTWTFAIAGRWKNTAAITSVQLLSSSGYFIDGTTFQLWGLNKL